MNLHNLNRQVVAKFLLKAQPKIITLDKNTRKARQYLKVEEDCENGKFNFMEIRNGGQTNLEGPNFGFEPLILYASLTESLVEKSALSYVICPDIIFS